MIVRAIDYSTGDWMFGKGINDYRRNLAAVTQNIGTRLNQYLGDCFFDLGAWIDWFNLLGANDLSALQLAISTVILNTDQVTGLLELSLVLDASRNVTIRYQVQTSYSTSYGTFVYSNSVG